MSANPADAGTVLGTFPVVQGDEAFIGAAISCDGVHFSPLKRLVASTVAVHGRATDHPVHGLVQRGDRVYLYTHRGVPGVVCP